MDVRTELRYPASPDAVFAMITDQTFVDRRTKATGAISHEASTDTTAEGGAVVRVDRVLPAVVPDFVRKFVGETLRVVQTDTWGPAGSGGTRTGSFEVEIVGTPGRMSGSLGLEPDGNGGTVQRFEGEVKIPVPFVGGKIEKSAADAVLAAVEKEGQVGRAWLAERA